MNKKILSILLSIFIIFCCFFKIDSFLESVSAYNNIIYVIVDDVDDYDFNDLYRIDSRFRNINFEFILADDFDPFVLNNNDMLVVENELLLNDDMNMFIKNHLNNRFIYFIGQDDINTISSYLGETLTHKQIIYGYEFSDEFESESVEEKIVPMDNVECSVLKYSSKEVYKGQIEFSVIGNNASSIEYLIPCCHDYLENNSIQPLSLSLIESGTKANWYMVDQTTNKTQINYVKSIYKVYKNVSETDSSKDYYVLVTENYFSEKGHYMIVIHDGASSSAKSLVVYPTNQAGTKSWSIGYQNLSFNYSGAKVKITLSSPNDYKNQWTFMDATLFNNAHFDSGDRFYSLTEFYVTQGKKPSFYTSVYALDKGVGKVDKSYTISVK